MEASAIFPHQLFARHPSVRHGRIIFLIEDQRFFGEPGTEIRFHKNKLILHRASMAAYQESLTASGHTLHYIRHEPSESMDYLFHPLKTSGINTLHVADHIDSLLEKRLHENSAKYGIALHIDPSPRSSPIVHGSKISSEGLGTIQ